MVMKGRRSLGKRLMALVTCVACFVTTVFFMSGSTNISNAASITSLPKIEELVDRLTATRNATYNILEIVADGESGSIGYYIGGQEPGGGEALNNALRTRNRTERATFANARAAQLEQDYLLGEGDDRPLRGSGVYEEHYPWETDDTSGFTQLNLVNEEKVENVRGTFTQGTGPNSHFRGIVLGFDKEVNGAFDRVIQYYIHPDEITERTEEQLRPGYSLYRDRGALELEGLVFRRINLDLDTDLGGDEPLAIYIRTGGHFRFYGTSINGQLFDPNGRPTDGFDDGRDYFMVDDDADDELERSEYALIVSFINVGSGGDYNCRFEYLYVGGGGGDHVYSPGDSDSPVHTVRTQIVFYTVNYSNNHWFLTQVFDRDPGDRNFSNIRFNVATVPARDVHTHPMYLNRNVIGTGYDMVVLTDFAYSGANDLQSEVAKAIFDSVRGRNVPIIVQHGLTGRQDSHAGRLARLLALGGTIDSIDYIDVGSTVAPGGTDFFADDFVRGSAFFYNASIANNSFIRTYDNPLPDGLGEVLVEIDGENLLRDRAVPRIPLLSRNVSPAKAVRYIINFAGRRAGNKWTAITVLEIQPHTGAVAKLNRNAAGEITNPNSTDDTLENRIWQWIGEKNNAREWMPHVEGGNGRTDINIVTMSAYEFVGRIEDLNETYHMIYIGSHPGSINATNSVAPAAANTETVYRDSRMNGLLYTNIGDLINQMHVQVGGQWQIQSHRNDEMRPLNLDGESDTYRRAGYDLTNRKMRDVIEFAEAGYPVIICDRLLRNNADSPSGVDAYRTGCRVDISSNMYRALAGFTEGENTTRGILGRDNVFSDNQARSVPQTVNRYLQLSKPQIVFDGENSRPREYGFERCGSAARCRDSNPACTREDCAMNAMTGRNMHFTFSIRNITDPAPLDTTYTVRFFLDLDGDGRYTADEEFTDIAVRQSGTPVRLNSLRADTTYTVSRRMPDSAIGLFAWQLRIEKNGDPNIRASQQGYTRIASPDGAATKINILQIASDSGSQWSSRGSGRMPSGTGAPTAAQQPLYYGSLNLEQQMQPATGLRYDEWGNPGNIQLGSFYGIYGELINRVVDFDINIITIYASELNRLATVRVGGAGTPLKYGPGSSLHTFLGGIDLADVDAVLTAFDMLIIGFDDDYGELSGAGGPIVRYIDTGRAVLFTHDTTSVDNRPGGRGNDFNNILRDAVNLDRYGVRRRADSDRVYSDSFSKGVDTGGIRGFTDYALKWRDGVGTGWGTGGGRHGGTGWETSTVAQVNSGKITRYPFDIEQLAGDDGNLRVMESHHQYYQLNMNSDDIVVWYTLDNNAGNNYYLRRDVMNGYYIYNRGNITYSGAGHSITQANSSIYGFINAGQSSGAPGVNAGRYPNFNQLYTNGATAVSQGTVNEAKLFVNTMIAAYRAPNEAPSVNFSDSTGLRAISTYYLPVDRGEEGGGAQELLRGEFRVHFNINDPNLNARKTVNVTMEFWLNDDDGWVGFNPEIFQESASPGTAPVSLGTNVTFTEGFEFTYYFEMPIGIREHFAAGNGEARLRLTANTTLTAAGGTPDLTSSAILDVRRIDLANMF
jgi:hypothetical protein